MTMTKEEAILHIEKTKEFLTSPKICWSKYDDKIIALDMAIEALQNTPICCKDCVFSTPDYPLRIFPNRTQAQARQYSCEHSTYSHDADFFCAYGEERKDYREFNF